MAAHGTLNTEQLISCTSLVLVDTFSSPQDSEGGVIYVSEVWGFHTKINDIIDIAMSKWMFLILLPGSVLKFGLLSSPFFTVSRTWFLIVRLAFMAI